MPFKIIFLTVNQPRLESINQSFLSPFSCLSVVPRIDSGAVKEYHTHYCRMSYAELINNFGSWSKNLSLDHFYCKTVTYFFFSQLPYTIYDIAASR